MKDSADRAGADQGEQAIVGLDRFGAFSDGVFAIAITLLALELTVPTGDGVGAALLEQWPEFLGYAISFAFIGSIWLTHARVTKLMRHADAQSAGINLLILILVAVLPFTTSLMVRNLAGPGVEVAVLVYGVNVFLASSCLSLLLVYLGRRRSLLVDDLADAAVADIVRTRWIAIGLNVVALVLAVTVPPLAVGLYLLLTAVAFVAPLRGLRRGEPS